MPLEAPNLDTRTFDELFRDARLRIPRYAPSWRDFNESDPGITLLQLFAWLTEQSLYELNRVPERSYIKFLQLVGMELDPAQPALAHVTFTATPGADVPPVPKGARLGAQAPGGGGQFVFETEAGLSPILLPLTHVQVFDGSAFAVVTAENETPGTPYRPFGWVPQVGSALYLGFSQTNPPATGRPFPRDLRIRVFLPPPAGGAPAQLCADAIDPPAPPVTLVFEHRVAADPTRWRRLNVLDDGSAALTQEGYLLVEGPERAVETVEGRIQEPRFWLRCRIAAGAYPAGRAAEIDFLRVNTVPAVNLSTVRDELVGTSEGHPDQTFALGRRPVQAQSLVVEVRERPDADPELWERRDDLLASQPDEPHFVLNATRGELTFGDGEHGRIPVAGAEIVAREYRFGGGAAGNVPAGAISTPLTPLTGIDAVVNDRPAVGGRDEQRVEDLKRQAPARLRHRSRAVTAVDFAALAEQAGGVARATALALAHPGHPGVAVPGAVTVVVVADTEDVPPAPSSELLRSVCRYLDGFRLLTAEVYVAPPRFVRVSVEARVAARPYAAFDAVAHGVREALDRHLSPQTWAFGAELYPTSLFSVLLAVEDVVAVPSLALVVEGRPHEPLSAPVKLGPDALVYGAGHEIVVQPAEDL